MLDLENSSPSSCVALLHGLARTRRSMAPMQRFLEENGFATANIGYPSTRFCVEELVAEVRRILSS